MHLLYVVDFDVEAVGESASAFDLLLDHVAQWLGRGTEVGFLSSNLTASGRAELPPVLVGSVSVTDRVAAWDTVDTGSDRALRVSVQQTLASGIELTTRATLSEVSGHVAFRVGISREYLGGALTPVRDTSVFQPGIVGSVARDEALRLSIGGQHVDERFHMVRDAHESQALATALKTPNRLPILLVHTRTAEVQDAAYIASRKLIGLARVITLNYSTREALQSEIPGLKIPFGGARLVWSDLAAPGVDLTAEQIEAADREVLRDRLMPRLAPVAALTRGIDEGWRRARLAVQRRARSDANARVRLAQEAADIGAERDALGEKVSVLETELTEAQDLAESYANDVQGLKSRAEAGEDLQAQVDYWKNLYLGQYEASEETEPDPWGRIPLLVESSDPARTFLALTDASKSCIVFTEAAERSWKKITYPDPADMTDALTTLARAARKLYSDNPGSIGHIDDWFKENFSLNVSTADGTIEKNKALRYFEFEGQRRDQTPHVKVRDGVKPNEVGRIHFAFDKDGRRLVVNHVALKLYGI